MPAAPAATSIEPADARLVYVRQGEFSVSSDQNVILSAILGSCVATCLFDPNRGIGGMNHILLPDSVGDVTSEQMEGVNLMELLINEMMKCGADKRNLQGKLFGGGRMLENSVDIGGANAAFARQFLADEGIPCIGESLGGDRGRRIRFWPVGGRARQHLLSRQETPKPAPRPEKRRPAPQPAPDNGDIELF